MNRRRKTLTDVAEAVVHRAVRRDLRAQLLAAELMAMGPMPDARDTDRGRIRAALVAAGAPSSELDYLVDLTPSVAEAMAYRPTQRHAWCGPCGGVRVVGVTGCAECQEVGQ